MKLGSKTIDQMKTVSVGQGIFFGTFRFFFWFGHTYIGLWGIKTTFHPMVQYGQAIKAGLQLKPSMK